MKYFQTIGLTMFLFNCIFAQQGYHSPDNTSDHVTVHQLYICSTKLSQSKRFKCLTKIVRPCSCSTVSLLNKVITVKTLEMLRHNISDHVPVQLYLSSTKLSQLKHLKCSQTIGLTLFLFNCIYAQPSYHSQNL